jgi:hypothetical protein
MRQLKGGTSVTNSSCSQDKAGDARNQPLSQAQPKRISPQIIKYRNTTSSSSGAGEWLWLTLPVHVTHPLNNQKAESSLSHQPKCVVMTNDTIPRHPSAAYQGSIYELSAGEPLYSQGSRCLFRTSQLQYSGRERIPQTLRKP